MTTAIGHNTHGADQTLKSNRSTGSGARFRCQVGHGYRFSPAGVAVDTWEELTEPMKLEKCANNVDMNVAETAVRQVELVEWVRGISLDFRLIGKGCRFASTGGHHGSGHSKRSVH